MDEMADLVHRRARVGGFFGRGSRHAAPCSGASGQSAADAPPIAGVARRASVKCWLAGAGIGPVRWRSTAPGDMSVGISATAGGDHATPDRIGLRRGRNLISAPARGDS